MQKNYYAKLATNNNSRFSASCLVTIINIYQRTLSPDHGPLSLYTIGKCRFRPTCSEFTKQAVQELGCIKGLQKGWEQIKKCH